MDSLTEKQKAVLIEICPGKNGSDAVFLDMETRTELEALGLVTHQVRVGSSWASCHVILTPDGKRVRKALLKSRREAQQ